MPPAAKKPKKQQKPLDLSSLSFACSCFGTQAEIDVLINGKWETIATVNAVDGHDAEDVARSIIQAISITK